jgi:UDP-GlcNAc:undecaprenyl-phosphate/decaprenyl-phosphate GlcNAc-1-phosphate transferase
MHSAVSFPVVLGLAFLATLVLLAMLLRLPFANLMLDHPNARSLHLGARPKVGGIAIVLVTFPLAVFGLDAIPMAVFWAAIFLVVISAIDDYRHLPARLRLTSHLCAALVVVIAVPSGNITLTVLALLTMAWMSNLYNFMDGADGMAGGMTLIGFAALALAAEAGGAPGLAGWCALTSAAAAAFLCFNFPPAKVFIGDAGAVPLGFLASALGYFGFITGVWPFWFPALVFAPFIFDASITLFKRVRRGEKPWVAHRDHAYQRLILAGWSHRKLALTSYLLMLSISAAAFAALGQRDTMQIVIIIVSVAVLAGVFLAIEHILQTSPASACSGTD